MGPQLMTLIGAVENVGLSVWNAVWIGVLVTVALGVIPVLFVVPIVFRIKRRSRDSERRIQHYEQMLEHVDTDERLSQHPRAPRLRRWLRREHADARFYINHGLGWRGGAVLAWSGMRGVVTLAAAQSLPTDFPYRTQLILIAFVVALITLVGQGGTLPWLIRVLGIRGTDEEHARRELSLLLNELSEAAATQVLGNPELHRRDGGTFDPDVLETFRKRAEREEERFRPEDPARQQSLELLQMITEAQQDALNEARSTGTYDSHTIASAQKRLDSGMPRLTGL